MSLIIAEEVLLLAYRDDTGKPLIGSTELNAALAGALLADLAISGRIDLPDKRVVVRDRASTGDEELDDTLTRIAQDGKDRKPEHWVGKFDSGKLRKRLLERLAAKGVLAETEAKVLGLFPTTRWPEADPEPEREVRRRVENALSGADPDERTAALIAVLHGSKLNRKAFPDASRERAKQIAEGEWTGAAVGRTIAAINAATNAAVIAAVSTSVASSAGS